MGYIERAIKSILQDRVKNSKRLLLTGARQVGKLDIDIGKNGYCILLQPYCASTLNRAIRTPKIYFRDTGLACYLTRWLTADALKVSAVAGNMFETFVISEVLKSFSNEGIDYRFSVSFYRGKDKKANG